MDGEQQHKTNFVLYTIPAAEALIPILIELIKNAKQYKGVRYISEYLTIQRLFIFIEYYILDMYRTLRPH